MCCSEFHDKLKTITFGHVQGGNRVQSGYDKEALENQFGNLEENEHNMMEATSGLGALKWKNGDAYKKDRNTGDYSKLTAPEYDLLMYGGKGEND